MAKLENIVDTIEQGVFDLLFDEIIPLAKAVELVAMAYNVYLNSKGINKAVLTQNTSDGSAYRSYGIYVEGVGLHGISFIPLPILEVTSRITDQDKYLLTIVAQQEHLNPRDHNVLDVNLKEMMQPYVGKDVQEEIDEARNLYREVVEATIDH